MKNKYEVLGESTLVYMHSNKVCIISSASLELILPYTWCVEGTGYVMSRTNGEAIKMHRLITNAPKGIFVDHIDGNPLNNRLDNLRLCLKQQNEFNTKIRSDNVSGYKGVSFDKRKHHYRAYITKDGKQYFLGYFSTKEEAAIAYNQKTTELFGAFARLNTVSPI